MLEVGNIIYFTPFYFPNGKSKSKPKYFVVLKVFDGKNILASLPTRNDYIPEKDTITDGCVELKDIKLNCFVISQSTKVTECGKVFAFPTHIYGHELDTYETKLLNEIYQIEGTDYEIFGKMNKNIFEKLIDCLKTSNSVKKKFIRVLNN
jgi:hypothetical protein